MTGKITAKGLQIDDDAVQIGKCIQGAESFSQCGIGGCTLMEVGGAKRRHCRCKAGEKAGFKVSCQIGQFKYLDRAELLHDLPNFPPPSQ